MSRWGSPVLRVLALVCTAAGCSAEESDGHSAGGTGGAGGTTDAAAGAGGGAAGCVDVRLTPSLLAGDDWNTPRALPGGLFRGIGGLHVVWRIQRRLPTPSGPPYFDKSRVLLVGSSFDPVSGDMLATSALDVFPAEITTSAAGLYSVAGREDGRFAAGFDYPVGTFRPQRVLFAKVGETVPTAEVVLPVAGDPGQISLQTAAAWDGEAFAMHAYGAPPQFTLHVARVSESGAVLLPFKQFGQTVNVNYILDGHVTSTNADSGRTYVFDSFSENVLNGHLRTGESFTSGPQKIQAVGLPPTSSANMAVVSADSSGAWLGWTQWSETESGKRDAIVQRVDGGGKPSGDAVLFSTEIAKPLGDPSGVWEWAISSQGGTGALVVAATHEGVYSKQITNGIPKDAIVVLDGNGAPELDARDFEIVEAQDERWVFFSEKHQGYVQILRVLKLVEGCVYPAALGAPE